LRFDAPKNCHVETNKYIAIFCNVFFVAEMDVLQPSL
jgi:hypothetical protein